METNQYKLELARAEAVVASIRVGLMFAGGMTTGVANTTVTGGGWNCAEPDDVDEGTWRGHAFLTSPVVTGG